MISSNPARRAVWKYTLKYEEKKGQIMKKKMIALLLALVMALSLAACGGKGGSGEKDDPGGNSSSGNTGTTPAESGTTVGTDGTVTTQYAGTEVETDKELPPFKVLVMYGTFTDKLGSQYKSALEYLAEPLNIEFTFLEVGTGGDDALTAIQAALVSGYDAALGTTANEAYVSIFQNAGVPYVVSGAMPSNEEQARTLADNYPMYLGSVVVDDYGAGYEMAESLYRDGCRNVMWNGLQRGASGQHDARALGFIDAVASHDDMNLITENYDYSAWADSIATAAATYIELDGVGCTAMSEAIYNIVETEGLVGTVRLAGIDVSEGTGRAFENGSLSYMAAGNYATEMISFAVLYNYILDGTRVIEDPAVNLAMNNINLNSLEDYNNYIKYLDSGVPVYTAQEILEMTHYYDESFDADAMTKLCQAYSLEDVMARHADLIG